MVEDFPRSGRPPIAKIERRRESERNCAFKLTVAKECYLSILKRFRDAVPQELCSNYSWILLDNIAPSHRVWVGLGSRIKAICLLVGPVPLGRVPSAGAFLSISSSNNAGLFY